MRTRTCPILLTLLLVLLAPPAHAQFHTADTNANQTLELAEVLRVVQFFNNDTLHCAEEMTEDGYAPGPGDQSCPPHDADFQDTDWTIALSELLRLIQLHRFGTYRLMCGSEDGFAPGAGAPEYCEGEGMAEGGVEGVVEGAPEGAPEGGTEGDGEAAAEGEGAAEGSTEGEGEGAAPCVPVDASLSWQLHRQAADTNLDLQISRDEYLAGMSTVPETFFDAMDTSADGFLNPEEIEDQEDILWFNVPADPPVTPAVVEEKLSVALPDGLGISATQLTEAYFSVFDFDDDDVLTCGDLDEEAITPEPFEEESPEWKRPALVCRDFVASNARPAVDENVDLQVVVENTGKGPSPEGTLQFLLDGEVFSSQPVPSLDRGTSTALGAALSPETGGRFSVVARVVEESVKGVADLFESTRATLLLRVLGAEEPVPEVEARLQEVDPANLRPGESYTFRIDATNPSHAQVEGIPWRAYVDNELIDSGNLGVLEPGQSEELTFPWSVIEKGGHYVTVEMDLPEGFDYAEEQSARRWAIDVNDETNIIAVPGINQWSSMGPAYIRNTGSVGRMDAIAIHPADPDIVYTCSPYGGIWKTTDGGQSWTPLGDRLSQMGLGSIAIDPGDGDIVYATHGPWWAQRTNGRGGVLYKSLDGGLTWSTFLGWGFEGYRELSVHRMPNGDVLIYAATNRGLYRYRDSDPAEQRSTAGEWTELHAGKIHDMHVASEDVSRVYLAVYKDGLYRSDDADAVSPSFTQLTAGLGAVVSNACIAAVDGDSDEVFASLRIADGVEIYSSDDAGANWDKIRTKKDSSNNVQFNSALAVGPGGNAVYFGGVWTWKLHRFIFSSWSETQVPGVHADLKAFAFDPHRPGKYYTLNDGGVYRCTSNPFGTDSSVDLNNGLRTTMFYDIDCAPNDSTLVLGGTQDNGSIIRDTGDQWFEVAGGDGNFCNIAADDASILYTQEQYFYQTKRHTWPNLSTANAGSTLPPGTFWGVHGFDNNRSQYVDDPNDPTGLHLIAQGPTVYYTRDGGAGWWNGGLVLTTPAGAPGDHYVSRVDIRHTVPEWFAGTTRGAIYARALPAAESEWEFVFQLFSAGTVVDMAFAPTNDEVLYVLYRGGNNAFRTLQFLKQGDGSWSVRNITSDLPLNRTAYCISADGWNEAIAYVGTNKGVYRQDSGVMGSGKWEAYNDGLPWIPVTDLEVDPVSRALRAATYGRGLWTVVTGGAL